MFPAPLRDKIIQAELQCFDAFSTPAFYTGGGVIGKPIQVCITPKSLTDEKIIQAYGVGSFVVMIKAVDAPVAQSLEHLTVDNVKYTLSEVFPIYVNDRHVFWRCIVSG